MSLDIQLVDYHNAQQAADLVALLNAYARDPMGGGEALSDYTQQHLIEQLRATPNALSLIAYLDNEAVGLLNAFQSLSTFAAKPLFNIHDLAVTPSARGQGVASALMGKLENIARARGACKITLEVLSGNLTAKALYERQGFKSYQLDPAMGQAEFLQKYL
ncbi:GNAT family N-acetyltransferase [Simiduia agarivorans]|uniref:N-acetyltransferase GCN5 n=1 Tax=Simiduia agarivorans (strain DSM 21679 / JCM 13881 / BCRC 17597 / SA1) TaxID=1117647 RepID=K4KLD4_SIMAS|nr:GNAT family N-acetyltransferase [Simiduia agarivorans]AFU99974.1 N-acetyltransferase GCN5 [Simiduia agarivorans SA1 = DSM 21679]